MKKIWKMKMKKMKKEKIQKILLNPIRKKRRKKIKKINKKNNIKMIIQMNKIMIMMMNYQIFNTKVNQILWIQMMLGQKNQKERLKNQANKILKLQRKKKMKMTMKWIAQLILKKMMILMKSLKKRKRKM